MCDFGYFAQQIQGFSRQRSVGNIDKLAMLAHTLHNVHEHHETRNIAK